MSFAWVLAQPDGSVIVQGSGPCNGRGNSLRSKGAGMLAVSIFISLVLTYTNRNSISLKCISDNQELINRMNYYKDYKYPFPNKTMKSKFDITE